ncbi:hypothetical protein [Halalkalibacterium ligniniphilum]|uniref:hypothetical protein n=1 Tax=Halalkalibacterium ligniniphilum TaxID=1134413 RepID=UPI001267312D|nr:hypothetical protein [Halalkalibacterium ligniniphilum]
MRKHNLTNREQHMIRAIIREIDLVTAVLLVTGQLTISRVVIAPGGFSLTVSGPLTGSERLESKTGSNAVNALIDVIDLLLAVLLIQDKINVHGVFITFGGSFSLAISGPIFGRPKIEPIMPFLLKNYDDFCSIVSTYFNVDQNLLEVFTKEGEKWR